MDAPTQITNMLNEAVENEKHVKKPSCRYITLRSTIIICTFGLVLINLLFSFIKELTSKTEFWNKIQTIMDQYINYKLSMRSNTTKMYKDISNIDDNAELQYLNEDLHY